MHSLILRFALFLALGAGVLYSYSISIRLTIVVLGALSVLLFCFGALALHRQLNDADEVLRATERSFSFCAYEIRAFVDARQQVWLRASDVRRYLGYAHSDKALASRFPLHYRKTNPAFGIWYMHPSALSALHVAQYADNSARLLSWLAREVTGPLQAKASLAPSSDNVPVPMDVNKGASLPVVLFVGGLLVAAVISLAGLIEPKGEVTVHYRWYALAFVLQFGIIAASIYCWGQAILIAVQRWLFAERAILPALFAALIGLGAVLFAANKIIDRENQFLFTDIFTMLLDIDAKPALNYDAGTRRITLDGELGFGTSKRLKTLLAQHPQATGIELKSYGGRAVEGFAMYKLVREKSLDTYVRAECMSACVLLFVGAQNRYVASSASFGLHRAGVHWQTKDEGMSYTDEQFVRILRDINVSEDFIARAIAPSIHDMYEPSPQEVLAAGLGTEAWSP